MFRLRCFLGVTSGRVLAESHWPQCQSRILMFLVKRLGDGGMSPRGRLYRPGTQTLAYSFWRAPRPKEALRVVRTPIGRRKRNSPEVRSGGIKFDRRMKALGGLPRRPHHPAGHALLGPFMFKH